MVKLEKRKAALQKWNAKKWTKNRCCCRQNYVCDRASESSIQLERQIFTQEKELKECYRTAIKIKQERPISCLERKSELKSIKKKHPLSLKLLLK